MKSLKYFFLQILIVYIYLYCLPYPLELLTNAIHITSKYLFNSTNISFFENIAALSEKANMVFEVFWQRFTPWFAKHILHYKQEINNFTNGSGDTLYDYTNIIVKLTFGIVFSILFLLIKITTHRIDKIYFFTLTYLRYYVGYILIAYGSVKIIPSQFPYPFLARLTQPYGESSPMGLAWTFMGYSLGYNLFMGFMEVIAGVLLLFRKTKTLGAILSIAVLSMVFTINICFDVPVKLFSGHLLFFTFALIHNDIKNLIGFFINNKVVQLKTSSFTFEQNKNALIYKKLRGIIIILIVILPFIQAIETHYEYGMGQPKPPLHGIYNMDYKIVNKDTVPLYYKDTLHWKQFIVYNSHFARIKKLNDSSAIYNCKVDTVKKTIELFKRNDSLNKEYYYYKYRNNKLYLNGIVKSDTIQMKLEKYDESKFLLNSRGFHWINEYPYNK